MGAGHRLFFALNPEAGVRQSIVRVQSQIADGKARPVPGERLHATLLFLGNHPEGAINSLIEAASSLECSPATISLDRVGWFPRAGVSWLGASDVPTGLHRLQADLALAVRAVDIEFDGRPWRFHLTLYRKMRKPPATISFEPIRWTIDGFELMESITDSGGLRYEVLARFGRQKAAD